MQKDRLELEYVGWGEGEESWSIDYVILLGDTAQPSVWDELAELLDDLAPDSVAIDSGYNTRWYMISLPILRRNAARSLPVKTRI